MGQLFTQQYPNNIRTIFGSINTVFQDDSVLICNTALVSTAITLLDIPADYWSTQYKLYVVDSGNASTNNITINAPSGFTINGQSSFVLSSNNSSVIIRVASNTNYIAQYSMVSGGVSGHVIQDEGTPLTQRTNLNFVGAGVTVTDSALTNASIVTVSGGASVISLTNAQMLALISASNVVAGQFYLINDAIYTNGGVVVQGVSNNKISLQGSAFFLNADYQSVGNYSGVSGFVSALGLWSTDTVPVSIGDCVVWNNLNYKNLTGAWGTAPNTDVVNWVVLTKSVTNGYILEVDFIKYNAQNNKIFYRADARGNEVELAELTINSLTAFQWGRNVVTRNIVSSQGYMDCTNSYCTFTANVVSQLGFIIDTTPRIEAGSVLRNEVSNGGELNTFYNKGTISDNVIKDSLSYIKYIGATKLINLGSSITSNVLTSGGQISYDSLGGTTSILANTISFGGTLTLNTILTTVISGCNINYSGVQITTSVASASLTDCSFRNVSSVVIATLSGTTANKSISNGFSNFETSLDMSNVSIYDLASKTLTIPTAFSYCGIFTLTNTSSNIIKKIVNTSPTHNSTFKPNNAQTVSFEHTLVSSAVANDLLCDAPSSTNVLTGRTNGCDFIEYVNSGNLLLRYNLVLVA
jgi:hypothetical protein